VVCGARCWQRPRRRSAVRAVTRNVALGVGRDVVRRSGLRWSSRPSACGVIATTSPAYARTVDPDPLGAQRGTFAPRRWTVCHLPWQASGLASGPPYSRHGGFSRCFSNQPWIRCSAVGTIIVLVADGVRDTSWRYADVWRCGAYHRVMRLRGSGCENSCASWPTYATATGQYPLNAVRPHRRPSSTK
jgi:hypothetical protein